MTNKFEDYLDENFHTFEGSRGVRNFEKLIREVCGYENIQYFLEDNPGAIETMVGWIGEWVMRVPEWEDNVSELVGEE